MTSPWACEIGVAIWVKSPNPECWFWLASGSRHAELGCRVEQAKAAGVELAHLVPSKHRAELGSGFANAERTACCKHDGSLCIARCTTESHKPGRSA